MTKKIMNQFCSQRQLATEYKRLFGIKPFAIADASRFFHLILWLSLSGSVKELSSVYPSVRCSTNNSDPRQTEPVSYI